MKLFRFIILINYGCLFFISCNNSKQTESQADSQDSNSEQLLDTTKITVDDTVLFKFDFAVANIPSPAALIYDIQKLGQAYDKTILTDPQRANSFPSEFKKAINMGIINIDMAYAVVNNMGADVIENLKGILILSDGLGLKNTMTSLIGKRAESNLSNKDSLFSILDDIYTKGDEYLRTNKRVYVASLIFTGSWVEILYLNSKIGEKVTDPVVKNKIYKLLWDQRFHLNNILNLLEANKGDSEYSLLITDLKGIHQLISEIKSVDEMTDAKYKKIYDKLTNLRIRLNN